ncbi:hypothetical protein TWF696_009787 [Orbilia brochopaga]|uniref:Uncharacterized protein n=1 Tax=Orbilia brochopaga TaxID=3140254 RepID=A0AAV9UFC5_9PEZI
MQLKTLLVALGIASAASAAPADLQKRDVLPPNTPFKLRRCTPTPSTPPFVSWGNNQWVSVEGHSLYYGAAEANAKFFIDEHKHLYWGSPTDPDNAEGPARALLGQYLYKTTPIIMNGAGVALSCEAALNAGNWLITCKSPTNEAPTDPPPPATKWDTFGYMKGPSMGTGPDLLTYILQGNRDDIGTRNIYLCARP